MIFQYKIINKKVQCHKQPRWLPPSICKEYIQEFDDDFEN